MHAMHERAGARRLSPVSPRVGLLWDPIATSSTRIDWARQRIRAFFSNHYCIAAQVILEHLFAKQPQLLRLTCADFVAREPKFVGELVANYFPQQQISAEQGFVNVLRDIYKRRETELAVFQ